MLADILAYMWNNLRVIPVIGVELEFYITKIEDRALANLLSLLLKPMSALSCDILKESCEHQYEIRLRHSTDILQLLRNLADIKVIVQESVNSLGGTTDFSAKPFLSSAGNAFHVHINLIDAHHKNLFFKYKTGDISEYLSQCIGGLCSYMKGHMAIFAPNENSYLRYTQPDIHTPTTISWGGNNRSVALRLPDTTLTPQNCRLEHRVPCSDCNYKTAVSAMLFSMIKGIENKICPPKKVFGIASDPLYNLEKLPDSLSAALQEYLPIPAL